MNQHELVPLTKNEVGFLGLLSLFVCFFTSLGTVIIINQMDGVRIINRGISHNTALRGFLILTILFFIPTSIENFLVFKHQIKIKERIPLSYRIARNAFLCISIIVTVLYVIDYSESQFLFGGIKGVTGIEFFDFFCYGAFIWLFIGLTFHLIDKLSLENSKFWETARDELYIFLNAKTKKERFLATLVLPLTVVSEELLFRGYLVLYLGNVFDSYILFGLISVSLSVIAHLYQGKGRVIKNLVFAGVLVILTIITSKILIATIIHLLNNYMVMFTQWRYSNRQHSINQ